MITSGWTAAGAAAEPVVVLEHAVRMYFGTQAPMRALHWQPPQMPAREVMGRAMLEARTAHTQELVDLLLGNGHSRPAHRLTRIFPGIEQDVVVAKFRKELRKAYGAPTLRTSPAWIIHRLRLNPSDGSIRQQDLEQALAAIDPLILVILRRVAALAHRPNLDPVLSMDLGPRPRVARTNA